MIEIEGADQLANGLHGVADQLDQLDRAAAEVGRNIQMRARDNAPKLTGRLAGSITARTESGDAIVGSDLIYAGVIHNGWAGHNISANPFLVRAVESVDIVEPYAREVQSLLSDVKGA